MEELNSVTKLVLGVIVVGVILACGFLILQQELSAIGTATPRGGTILNESITFTATNTQQTLVRGANAPNGACGTITSVTNATNVGEPILVANFTQVGCKIINATAIFPISESNEYWNASYVVFVSYPYTTSTSHGYNATNTSITALNTIPTWLPILILVFIAGIVIAMIIVWQNRGSRAG